MQLPTSDVTTTDEYRQQQQQAAGGEASDENVGAASVGGCESALGAGEWYQPRCRTTRYEPVVCRTSTSDPDVTPRPRTDNHYT